MSLGSGQAQGGLASGLYVVSTPIGNLADMTNRAVDVLKSVDLVACEDTRHSGLLLQHYHIRNRLTSYHEYNKVSRTPELIEQLRQGRRIALITDAGTPGISDPGFYLIRAAVRAGVAVMPVPGASALLAGLVVSGLPSDRFAFEGFLPARGAQRQSVLAQLATDPRTLVLFEAPHRIAETLNDLSLSFGAGRPAVVARELTKLHETIYRGSLGELARMAAEDPNLSRGEITLVIGGSDAAEGGDRAMLLRALRLLLEELPPARAAAIAAQLSGVRRSEAYELALQLRPGTQES